MALALMCGLSFAGKSTFAARLADGVDAELTDAESSEPNRLLLKIARLT